MWTRRNAAVFPRPLRSPIVKRWANDRQDSRCPRRLAACRWRIRRCRRSGVALRGRTLSVPAIFVPPEFPAAAAGSLRDFLFEHLSTAAIREIGLLTATRAPHLGVDAPIVRMGQPWRLILEVADELDVDLIVLGSHGYHGLDRILGTTAARVANVANRNVLVVHELTGLRARSTNSVDSAVQIEPCPLAAFFTAPPTRATNSGRGALYASIRSAQAQALGCSSVTSVHFLTSPGWVFVH